MPKGVGIEGAGKTGCGAEAGTSCRDGRGEPSEAGRVSHVQRAPNRPVWTQKSHGEDAV